MYALDLIVKYGDQLGSNFLNGLLFECHEKVLECLFELKAHQHVLSSYN
jgi:hypothetical protein